MRRVTLALIAIGAVVSGQGAFAADLPYKAPAPAQIVSTSWSGFYAGADVGWAHNSARGTSDFTDTGSTGSSATNPQSNSAHDSGVAGGVYIGYNFQVAPNVVTGFEGDWTWIGSKYSFCRQTDTGSLPCSDNDHGFETIQSKLDWMSTFRGRLGLTYGNLLLYGTGGLAVGQFKTTLTQNCLAEGCGAQSLDTLLASGTSTRTLVGWTAGGGIESMLARNWLLRIEYLHADFGRTSDSFSTLGSSGAQTTVWSRRETEDLVRVGAAYKFN